MSPFYFVQHHRLQQTTPRGYRCRVERPIEKYAMTINLGALSALCIVLGCVLGLLIGGAIGPSAGGEPWIRTYGSLVGTLFGFAGTIVGFAVATRNMLRQMHINLISREEDRIERTLPGLHDARDFLFYLSLDLRREGGLNVPSVLAKHGIRYVERRATPSGPQQLKERLRESPVPDDEDVEKAVATLLPRCGPAIQQLVALSIISLTGAIKARDQIGREADKARAWLRANPTSSNEDTQNRERLQQIIDLLPHAEKNVQFAMQVIEKQVEGFSDQLQTYQQRLPRYRATIEKYLGE